MGAGSERGDIERNLKKNGLCKYLLTKRLHTKTRIPSRAFRIDQLLRTFGGEIPCDFLSPTPTLSLPPSPCLCFCLSVSIFVSLSLCLSVHLCLSVCVSVCLSVCLSVSLPHSPLSLPLSPILILPSVSYICQAWGFPKKRFAESSPLTRVKPS